jgi:anti-sigma regulatory factor (Ser/Thr protein kinase)
VDHGEGIDTFAIPRVAFQSGYTTKSTMGLGYTLMLAVCDRVMLASGPGGTTVIMEKRLNLAPESGQVPVTACPDSRP